MKAYALPALIAFLFVPSAVLAGDLPSITDYQLDIRFALKEQRVDMTAKLTITNTTSQAQSKLPFLLYRLFTVERVTGSAGSAIGFTQDVVLMKDEPSWQVTQLVVNLPSPLKPGDTTRITVAYGGYLFGYPEVMAYVKDHIDEQYSLIRPDALAYPMLADPSFANLFAAYRSKFTYQVSATVPPGYRAACGGELLDSHTYQDRSTFVFRSKIPTWRIDVAVAQFALEGSADDNLEIYYLPEDSTGARRILKASRDAVEFYTTMFGKPMGYKGYTIIEIPDGWGSQASDYYFLQTAAAFKDSTKLREVYHEIGHTWNAMQSPEVERCRYFDEAFASFFQALAVRQFEGEDAFKAEMERTRSSFVQRAGRNPQALETPIAGYGAKELGGFSYTKGAWSLYVLYELVGEETFASIIREMLATYWDKPIDFGKFQKLCEEVSGRDLRKYFQEWIYGTQSSKLLVDQVPIDDIVKRY